MTDKIDSAVRNGIDQAQQEQQEQQPPQSPLNTALARHAEALMKLNTIPGTNQVGVDPRQLMCDLEVVTVRMQVLFLALIEAKLIDGNRLTSSLATTLNAEAAQMERMVAEQPRLMVPS